MPDSPTPLDLDAIEAAIAACRTYNFGMYQADRLAHEHAPALVEEVKHGGWFEFGCMGICDKAPRGVTSCPLPGGAS